MNSAPDILIRNARIVTPAPRDAPARGSMMSELIVIPNADIAIKAGKIEDISMHGTNQSQASRIIDANGRVVIPGFVDCHTHLCYAGDRIDEWEMKLRGVPYLEILKQGGGIMSTVRAVRRATHRELAQLLRERLDRCLKEGTTSIEVKSGYGLSTRDEIKMLEAIMDAASNWPGTVVPCALIGHAIDGETPDFIERTITETLDEVHRCFPGICIDAYVEQGAWSVENARRLLDRARSLGHPVRAHVDQFNSIGGIGMCIELGAVSADHLEAADHTTLASLAQSNSAGVALPICGMHLDGRYADLRSFVDCGGAACIATNCNPGSAPSFSMPCAIAAATRHCGISYAEAICASTLNPARLLKLNDRGAIHPGTRADLCVLDTRDERDIAFMLGGRPVRQVIVAGKVQPV